jgi:hypothetical protein
MSHVGKCAYHLGGDDCVSFWAGGGRGWRIWQGVVEVVVEAGSCWPVCWSASVSQSLSVGGRGMVPKISRAAAGAIMKATCLPIPRAGDTKC